jgi:hypothetical protein
MNTYTLFLIGRTIGQQAFKSGKACMPTADSLLIDKLKTNSFSISAQKYLVDGFMEGWRGAELDNNGW